MRIRIVGTVILLAIVAVFWLADDARAYDEWSGGCKATVSISPEAQATYGPEIGSALGRVSQATGIEFRSGDAPDITFLVADVSWIGPTVLGAYDYEAHTITLIPVVPPAWDGQRARQYENMRQRLVLHEVLHWLGLGHDASPHEVMYPTIIDDAPRLGASDRMGLRAAAVANGCAA